MTRELLNELISSPLMLDKRGWASLQYLVNESAIDAKMEVEEGYNILQDFLVGNVAIIPVFGVLNKYGRVQEGGIDAVAALLQEAEADPKVKGSVLLINSPGGTSISPMVLENTVKRLNKPVAAVIDGMCASAAYYVACLCDAIYATHRLNEIGSIGCYCTLINDNDMLESYGLKVVEIYPPESKDKNLGIRKAKDGDTKLFIDEQLSPIARNFQALVVDSRGEKLPHDKDGKLLSDGILTGKTYFAEDAHRLGLIDGITTLTDIINAMQ